MLQKQSFPSTWTALGLKIAGILVIVMLYQNCGGGFRQLPESLQGVSTESSAVGPVMESNDLGYPYFEKPEFMADLSLLSIKVVDSSTHEFEVEGVIVDVDSPETGVNYEVHWENSSGQEICPVRKGLTEKAFRSFQYSCVATKTTSKLTAKIYAQSSDQSNLVLVRSIDFEGL